MISALAAGTLALKINVDSESIIVAVYDIIEQGILGYWLLIAHDSSPGVYVLHFPAFPSIPSSVP